MISVDECTSHDIDLKRREFVGKYHSLHLELGDQSPVVYLKLINIFLSHFYGHCLWDYSHESAERLWRTWNVMCRDIYNLPYATHRYILEQVSCVKHIKIRLLDRFRKFKVSLQNSNNKLVTNLLALQAGDMRSTFGRNCSKVDREISASVYDVPENSDWKINLIKDILDVKSKDATLNVLTTVELSWILNDICIN